MRLALACISYHVFLTLVLTVFPMFSSHSSLSSLRSPSRTMEFRMTPEWVASLRRDVQIWDLRVKEKRGSQWRWIQRRWDWPDMTPPLKYAGADAELVGIQPSMMMQD